MTANSPVTMDDLVNGLIFDSSNGYEARVELVSEEYRLKAESYLFNTVDVSSDGLTVTFGGEFTGGHTFTGFTFNA